MTARRRRKAAGTVGTVRLHTPFYETTISSYTHTIMPLSSHARVTRRAAERPSPPSPVRWGYSPVVVSTTEEYYRRAVQEYATVSDDLPNYTAVEPPGDKPIDEYSPHERRAEILRLIREAGSPFAIKQVRLADRYDVHESTISRDMDRLRESVADHLGDDAKLTTRALFEKTVKELQNEGEWKAAWDIVMDWNSWLGDLGRQEREPHKLDVDVESRHAEVAYTVVREGEADLPTTEAGEIDHEALGFTSAPAAIEVEAVEDADD